jgi:hypothetical protein
VNRTSTVYGSITLTPESWVVFPSWISGAPSSTLRYPSVSPPLFPGRRICSKVHLTSFAVNSRPLWNLTPLRRWKRKPLLSGFASHRTASAGTMIPSLSISVNPS